MPGKLIILSAPSGAGKSSLAKALTDSLADTVVSVSHTTRAPRRREQDGVHYHFVARAEFERMAAAGEFIEHARVFDNYYGTARAAVERELQAGRNVLLDIDWPGARRIKPQMPQAVSVFILPPARATLEQRLRARGQDAEAVIARRMRDAVAEMRHYHEFDHVVVNDDFQAALADLTAIIRGRPAAVRRIALDMDELLRESVEKNS